MTQAIKNNISFMVATDKNYLKYLRVLMVSVYENHRGYKVDFYVFHSELDSKDQKYVSVISDQYNQRVYFCKVNPEDYDVFMASHRWPQSCLYILTPHKYLPEELDRIIYLDIDTVVVDNLSELWTMSFDDAPMIVSPENWNCDYEKKLFLRKPIKYELEPAAKGQYFNSGMVTFNLEKMRKLNISLAYYEDFLKQHNISSSNVFFDQGLLNLVFAQTAKYLDSPEYNYRISFSAKKLFSRERYIGGVTGDYDFIEFKPKVIHYCGYVPLMGVKPWHNYLPKFLDRSLNVWHHYIPELYDYFNQWWKYCKLVPDYEQIRTIAEIRTQAYLVCNDFFIKNSLETVNMLAVETLRIPNSSLKTNDILSNEDLNDFTNPKVYRCVTGAVKKTVKNLPEDFVEVVGFRLTVKYIAAYDTTGGISPVIQILEPNLSSAVVYRRHRFGGVNAKWGEWQRLATTGDIDVKVQELNKRIEQLELLCSKQEMLINGLLKQKMDN